MYFQLKNKLLTFDLLEYMFSYNGILCHFPYKSLSLFFQEQRRKQEEKARKKAEVRKRLEESTKSKKCKKGFMTPERKKKLRVCN